MWSIFKRVKFQLYPLKPMGLMYRFLAEPSSKLMIGSLKNLYFELKGSSNDHIFYLYDSFRIQAKVENKEEEHLNWMKVSNFTSFYYNKALKK